MPYAGKQQGLRFLDALRRACTRGLRAEPLERSLHRGDVSYSIVNQSEFHISPLVLGSTRRRRLSRATAKRNARAKALNMVSIW